jgi:hypothetical protein
MLTQPPTEMIELETWEGENGEGISLKDGEEEPQQQRTYRHFLVGV